MKYLSIILVILIVFTGCELFGADDTVIVNDEKPELVPTPTPSSTPTETPLPDLSESSTKMIDDCDKNQAGRYRYFCYFNVAKTNKELAVCEYIETIKDKESCYSIVARELRDKKICEKITDQANRYECERVL